MLPSGHSSSGTDNFLAFLDIFLGVLPGFVGNSLSEIGSTGVGCGAIGGEHLGGTRG